MGRNRPGLSLPEVVIVMAILVMLAAVCFPVFAGARKAAQETLCVSNLRQLYVAITLYRQEQGGDGVYGTPVEMGLPDGWRRLPISVDLKGDACRGLDPIVCHHSYGYNKAWPTQEAQFHNQAADEAWARYVRTYADASIIAWDDHHQFACPVTEFSKHRTYGLHLDGHVKLRIRFGESTNWYWWHDDKNGGS